MTLISILVPVYNEEATIQPFLDRIEPVIAEIQRRFGCDTELIFTDNCSADSTPELLEQAARTRPFMRVFRFSRNVGFQRSIISGYALARGAACVQIDCDLEDPPEKILEFIEAWQAGFKVVYGIRRSRKESLVMRAVRRVFYRLVNVLSEDRTPVNAGDFRLIDRRVIEVICQVNDAEPYLRGLISSLGFKQKGIEFDRESRIAGETKFTLRQYMSIAADGILQSSIKPLSFSLWVSGISLIASLLLTTFYVVSKLLGQIEVEGFVTLAALGLLQFSVLLLMIGINSLYLGRVYRQVFRRPISIVEVTRNSDLLDHKPTAVYWPGDPSQLLAEHDKALQQVGHWDHKDHGDSSSKDLAGAKADR